MLTKERLEEAYGSFLTNEVSNLKDGETKTFNPSRFQQIVVRAIDTPAGREYIVKSYGVLLEALSA